LKEKKGSDRGAENLIISGDKARFFDLKVRSVALHSASSLRLAESYDFGGRFPFY
jgi:hypothetical protein